MGHYCGNETSAHPFDTLVSDLVRAAIRKSVERISERRGTEVEIGLQPWWLTEGAPQSHLGQDPEVSGREMNQNSN